MALPVVPCDECGPEYLVPVGGPVEAGAAAVVVVASAVVSRFGGDDALLPAPSLPVHGAHAPRSEWAFAVVYGALLSLTVAWPTVAVWREAVAVESRLAWCVSWQRVSAPGARVGRALCEGLGPGVAGYDRTVDVSPAPG